MTNTHTTVKRQKLDPAIEPVVELPNAETSTSEHESERIDQAPLPDLLPVVLKGQEGTAWKIRRYYDNAMVLAPMVRSGTMVTRLQSLAHGAQLVWGPEMIAQSLVGTTRVVMPDNTVHFTREDRTLFHTHPVEIDRFVFQIGAADPKVAVEAARKVKEDVSQIDLNCGCPKSFSTSGGMGAALLTNPDVLVSILRALVEDDELHSGSRGRLPISCKIRLLPESLATLNLVRQLAKTGISLLTVHCRTKNMRPGDKALIHRLQEIVDEMRQFGIPVICNGDCTGDEANYEAVKAETGVTSVMIARAAEQNPTCFALGHQRPKLDPKQTSQEWLRLAVTMNNPIHNTRFMLSQFGAIMMLPKKERNEWNKHFMACKTTEDLCSFFEVDYQQARLAGDAALDFVKRGLELTYRPE